MHGGASMMRGIGSEEVSKYYSCVDEEYGVLFIRDRGTGSGSETQDFDSFTVEIASNDSPWLGLYLDAEGEKEPFVLKSSDCPGGSAMVMNHNNEPTQHSVDVLTQRWHEYVNHTRTPYTKHQVSDPFGEANSDNNEHGGDISSSNLEEFNRLKEQPEYASFFSNMYSDLEPDYGKELGRGGQAKVYEATGKSNSLEGSHSERFVVKVFDKSFRLVNLKNWWPTGLLQIANSSQKAVTVPYVCWALSARLLGLNNQFAFVFPRLNSDLLSRIDWAMKVKNGDGKFSIDTHHQPPFSPFTCFCIISDIAAGMAQLHSLGLLHHDLKAANALDQRNVCEDETCIMMHVADFESSNGAILGTRFWRAPEILRHAQSGGMLEFSERTDVYGFAMTCYEVVTGLVPFEDRAEEDIGDVIGGLRPAFPQNSVATFHELIIKGWDNDPGRRPTFDDIRKELKELGKRNAKIWDVNIRYKHVQLLCGERVRDEIEKDDWEWPIYDQWRSETGIQCQLRAALREKEEKPAVDTPFIVIHKQDMPITNTVVVELISRELIEIARKCLLGVGSKGNFELSSECDEDYDSDCDSDCGLRAQLSREKPRIDARDMYIALTALKDENESIQQDATASAAKKWPLKHLLRFLESHFKDTTTQVERTKREKRVSYDLLWAFLHRGVMVSYTCAMTSRTLQGIVRSFEYQASQHRNHFLVHLECRDYNGYTYVKGSVTQSVAEFKGEVLFDGIGISPMSLLDPSTEERLLKTFLDNGTKFYEIVALQQSVLMEYEGPSFTYSRRSYGLRKQKADGRVMVDLLSFARMNPEYDLGNATPPKTRNAPPLQCDEQQEKPSPEELRLAPALVYGFSFANKKWAAFDINGLSTVEFDDEAFDRDLVLADQRRKEMLLALVRQYVGDHGHVPPKLDPISKKGDGCVFLCFGPPGTGKTLTAESIAEKLHRPLWSVSVSELGSTSAALETNLMEILDIASQWRAVLLLDEADLYLEKRTSNADPNRIAMTSIFLRVLEYYRGVLFLTTNRVTCFDDAFCSRISMFLRFRSLSESQREEIWKKLLSRAGVQNPDLELFKKAQLNGREIRNCIRVAQTWAMSSGVVLTVDHVAEVMEMLGEVRQDLESAIIEESTERPIARALERVSLKHS